MIDAKELRRLNYVLVNNDLREDSGAVVQINEIREADCQVKHKDNTYGQKYKFIHPIPLTEQWLLDFRFNYDKEDESYSKENSRYKIAKVEDYKGFFICDGDKVLRAIDYVHELQIGYLFLASEELQLKSK